MNGLETRGRMHLQVGHRKQDGTLADDGENPALKD